MARISTSAGLAVGLLDTMVPVIEEKPCMLFAIYEFLNLMFLVGAITYVYIHKIKTLYSTLNLPTEKVTHHSYVLIHINLCLIRQD